jgi:hypothetical protein
VAAVSSARTAEVMAAAMMAAVLRIRMVFIGSEQLMVTTL